MKKKIESSWLNGTHSHPRNAPETILGVTNENESNSNRNWKDIWLVLSEAKPREHFKRLRKRGFHPRVHPFVINAEEDADE